MSGGHGAAVATGAPLLEIDHLAAGYDTPVIRGISLRVDAGERLGLSGKNGAGKSTLMRAIVGMARRFDGNIHRPRGRLAYLAQQAPDSRESPVTGRDALALMGVPASGLPDRLRALLDARLDRVSAGERQLVKAWAVVHHDCDLVLLDEPSSSLDDDAKRLLAGAIAAFPPARAALIISHDHAFLRAACTAIREFPS
jgi:ATPase subunit of ABC transporter with duplicated ATPase domains